MYGWIVAYAKNGKKLCALPACVTQLERTAQGDGYFAGVTALKKFEQDRLLLDDENALLLLDGAFFNNQELIKEQGGASWAQTARSLAQAAPNDFFNRFRGTFNGMYWNKKSGKAVAFTDHIASRNVYYYENETVVLVASNFNLIVETIKINRFSYTFSINAAKYMFSYGFMIDDSTFYEQVKKLYPGHCLRIEGKRARTEAYFTFDNRAPQQRSEQEYIDLLDETFRQAVRREFGKDQEYGYRHLADMSGGLDSRMVSWVARDLGFGDTVNLCYSQSGYLDETVAQQVANALDNEFFFESLDTAAFIYDIDEMVKMNFGSVFYASFTGGNRILRRMNLSDLGMQHTGLLGDMDEGSFALHPYHEPPAEEDRYRFSHLLESGAAPEVFNKYPNQELCWFSIRGMMAGCSTNLIRQHYTETYSPFADVEFLQATFSIPLEVRMNGIFKSWMIQRYPEATRFVYAKHGCRITDHPLKIRVKQSWYYTKEVRILRRLMRWGVIAQKSRPLGMNPYDYWYENNARMREFMDGYFRKNLNRLQAYPAVYEDAQRLYTQGNTVDKLCVLTVLSVLKNYF